MEHTNLTEFNRLFADWGGKHHWQEYDSQQAIYPNFYEFMYWWESIEFRYYDVKPDRLMVMWGVGRHPLFSDVRSQELLITQDFDWFKIYENTTKDHQWTIDNTIKVMVSMIQHGVMARANIRRNGPWSINKGGKLALSCYLLDINMPTVVALSPDEEWPVELEKHSYTVIKEPKDLVNVYPPGSRAVLLPRKNITGIHNIDCWTLHKDWETDKDYGHTQFPDFDWERFFKFLWEWCKPHTNTEIFSFHHHGLGRHVLMPCPKLGKDKWLEFWKDCASQGFL